LCIETEHQIVIRISPCFEEKLPIGGSQRYVAIGIRRFADPAGRDRKAGTR